MSEHWGDQSRGWRIRRSRRVNRGRAREGLCPQQQPAVGPVVWIRTLLPALAQRSEGDPQFHGNIRIINNGVTFFCDINAQIYPPQTRGADQANTQQKAVRPAEPGTSSKLPGLEKFIKTCGERAKVAQSRSRGCLFEYFLQLGLDTGVSATSWTAYDLHP